MRGGLPHTAPLDSGLRRNDGVGVLVSFGRLWAILVTVIRLSWRLWKTECVVEFLLESGDGAVGGRGLGGCQPRP